MKRTVITHPDGTVTTIRSRSSCGCGGFFTALAVLFVIALPLEWRLPLMILAYVFLAAVMGLAAFGLQLKNAKPMPRQPSAAPPPPPRPPPDGH
jgi:uncharacterized iron-regulated membrane protein